MYPHDKLVRAWLDGKPVQYLNDTGVWVTMGSPASAKKMPHFYARMQYRLAPVEIRVRHALVGGLVHMAQSLADEKRISSLPDFNRWLDDWVEL